MKFSRVRLAAIASLFIAASLLVAQPKDKPKKLALLVGVNNYEGTGLGSLNHTVRDMEALEKKLKETGFEVELLPNTKATKANIEAALKRMKEKRAAGDLVLVGMSGHGVQTRNSKGDEDAFFCPAGCDKSEIDSLVSLTALVQSLGSKGVNLVLVDACRDDPRKGFRGIQGNELQDRLPANTAILFSCSAGEQSFETNRMFGTDSFSGHGVFFYQVLEGLGGKAKDADGEVTWDTLVNYVKKSVNARAKEWFDDRAKSMAKDRGVDLSELRMQTPHALSNLQDSPVLAKLVAGSSEPANPMAAGVKPGEERAVEIALGVKMVFCWVPAGEAQLGSPKAERLEVMKQRKEEKESYWLAVEAEEVRGKYRTDGFWLGKYSVTQAEWKAVTGKDPSKFKGERLPVGSVSWNDCQDFLKMLNERSGIKAVFGSTGKFVLPHEDQWEYACRGGRGNARAFYFGGVLNGIHANCNGDCPFGTTEKGPFLKKTTEVGSFVAKSPHPWSLCDMHGNVWQWCENRHSSEDTYARVLRGGSWSSVAWNCRSAFRRRDAQLFRSDDAGFRVCFPLN